MFHCRSVCGKWESESGQVRVLIDSKWGSFRVEYEDSATHEFVLLLQKFISDIGV